jgi:hypothetical protein
MEKSHFQQRAEQVIKPLIPADAEERVTRSFKQWNQIIREHIRTETGLKLSDGDNRYSIPVRIVKGFTEELARLIGGHGDPELWRLIVGQPKIGGIIEGLQYLLTTWPQFEQWSLLPAAAKGSGPTLQRTLEIAEALQRLALAREVRERIKQIREDILGTYNVAGFPGYYIELYWMPIAMVAAMLGVRIEDLTLVVLAHELAHGYTHLGRDIDGTRWEDSSFIETEREVVEGLAQFYTQVVMERLASRTPSLKTAYEQLLGLQGGPYLVHQDWLKDDQKQRGETIRFAMVAARSHGTVEYAAWKTLLEETNKRLKTKMGQMRLFDGR